MPTAATKTACALVVEQRPVAKLIPYVSNSRTHTENQISQVAASIKEFGWTNPILIGGDNVVIAGHARLLAAKKLDMKEVPVIVLDHLSKAQRKALVIADNKLAINAGWDDETLAAELKLLEEESFDLSLLGFDDKELAELLKDAAGGGADVEEELPETPAKPVTQPGDLWVIGGHRLICGDCRDRNVINRLFGVGRANIAITSPPYASQREYDADSGFKPIPPAKYVEWFAPVAAGIEAVLASTGSYFLNIKEHADEGERDLYVKDLVIAHRRQWGWRFVDEFCWRKTNNGVPGKWPNRFKNAWEPVFHFSRQAKITFRPEAVGHVSDDCFDYSPNNPKASSNSGLLGSGTRGKAAGKRGQATDGFHEGVALPSNVIETKTESDQGSHTAPFPRGLVEFFLNAFSDVGDIAFDPFTGSGTTLAAAEVLERLGYGCEISAGYCDVTVHRMEKLSGCSAVLESTGKPFNEVAAEREKPEHKRTVAA